MSVKSPFWRLRMMGCQHHPAASRRTERTPAETDFPWPGARSSVYKCIIHTTGALLFRFVSIPQHILLPLLRLRPSSQATSRCVCQSYCCTVFHPHLPPCPQLRGISSLSFRDSRTLAAAGRVLPFQAAVPVPSPAGAVSSFSGASGAMFRAR